MMESNLFLLLANISNINKFDTSSTPKVIALIFSLFVLVILSIFILLSLYTVIASSCGKPRVSRFKWEEFLGGIRDNNKARLYSFLSLVKRSAMVLLLILGEAFSPQIIVIGLVFILALYLMYLILVRPFKEVSNNIIEIINEIFLIIITAWLGYFNTESKWSNSLTKTFIFIITSNTLVITGIILVCFIITL